jgi:2,4-dienoyl-CoA reductase-like NADH-dependent reductase (Old Yellow Enzyme family)
VTEAKTYPKLTRFRAPAQFRDRLANLGLDLPVDDEILSADQGSPMAHPINLFDKTLTNRWCIHPMEGWDGTPDGKPTDATLRRWRNFGLSGAKLIWGGEAVAVRHDGRANPNQLLAHPDHQADLALLRDTLLAAHRESAGSTDHLAIGLQLTHSGRFAKPNDNATPEPRIAFHHPILDRRVGIAPNDDTALLTDDDLQGIIDAFVAAARLAAGVGYDFVDIKHCHGYLGHELLGGHTRPGKFGGSFENRTRFLREVIGRIRDEAPGLHVGVRLSAFDFVPFSDDPQSRTEKRKGVGIPEPFDDCLPYRYGFGIDADNPLAFDLTEVVQFLKFLKSLNIRAVNVSCGSPYYNPHIQRPAIYPPSDGYQPPEDPLVGVERQIRVTRLLKEACPDLVLIGTGYSYLQEFIPHVAQAVVRNGWADLVGVGRLVLSYPELPADTLAGRPLQTKRICRTFSDCTTAPRNGIISGCYPLDPFYKKSPEAVQLRTIKQNMTQ